MKFIQAGTFNYSAAVNFSFVTPHSSELSFSCQARANENVDGFEEGYDSSRDEVSSVSSYNPAKANVDFVHRNSLSMQSMSTRLSTSELYNSHGEHSGFPSYAALPRLSISEVIDDPGGGMVSIQTCQYTALYLQIYLLVSSLKCDYGFNSS